MRGGATVVQVREKDADGGHFLREAAQHCDCDPHLRTDKMTHRRTQTGQKVAAREDTKTALSSSELALQSPCRHVYTSHLAHNWNLI